MENTMKKETGNKIIEQIKNEATDVDLKQQLSEHFKLS